MRKNTLRIGPGLAGVCVSGTTFEPDRLDMLHAGRFIFIACLV